MSLLIRRAGLADLDVLVPMFDAYRQFYDQPSDPARGRAFLEARLEQEESLVFLAFEDGRAVGFTQLFPSFSSASMAPVLILNDLYVAPEVQRAGVARALLTAAADHGREVGAVRLTLSTGRNNLVAQAAYERLGWKPSTDFQVYNLAL